MKLQSKLFLMHGKTFMYKTVLHKVIITKEYDETIMISTDKDLIVIKRDDIESALKEFLEVEGEALINANDLVIYKKVKEMNFVEIIKNNIKKVQEDPSFVKQSMAIDRSVNTLLNVVKMELAVKKAGGEL